MELESYETRIGLNEQLMYSLSKGNVHGLIGGLVAFWGPLKWVKMQVSGIRGAEGSALPRPRSGVDRIDALLE